MSTPIVPVRLSPSGKRISGIHLGSGSAGRKWRALGAMTSIQVVGAVVPITDLDAIPVDLQPGYLYELDLHTNMQTVDSTDTTNGYHAVYRLRNKISGVWGAWTSFPTSHVFPLNQGHSYEDRQFWDALPGVAVTSVVDQIGFGVQGSAAAGTSTFVVCTGCDVVISEYLA